MLDKASLRKEALQQRYALSAEERQARSATIIQSLIAHFDWSKINCVHCYLSHQNKLEIDTWPFIEYLFREQPQIAVVTNRMHLETQQLDCCLLQAHTQLTQNHFGIEEPHIQATVIDPKKIQLMIVPLLACDYEGNRLGYGKGYYDRLLAQCNTDMLRVGVNYFPPCSDILPYDAHDIPLHGLITNEGYFNFSSNKSFNCFGFACP